MFSTLPRTLQLFISPLLALLNKQWAHGPIISPTNGVAVEAPIPIVFELRHVHATYNKNRVVMNDVKPTPFRQGRYSVVSPPPGAPGVYSVDARRISTQRPIHDFTLQDLRAFSTLERDPHSKEWWKQETVLGPDVESKQTLIQLAKLAGDAYFTGPEEKEWYEPGDDWGENIPFGWEPPLDGLRGHVFVSRPTTPSAGQTVVISIKGTSAGWLAGSNGPSVKRDKFNDNVLFSCCCARVGPSWSPVCGCFCGRNTESGGSRCDDSCLTKAVGHEDVYFSVAADLYRNVTYMYPDADIWIVGHSLGGAISSLLGATFGAPVVAFEAPGEKRAAMRLHLPSSPSTHHITHVFHTADPIAMGACNGMTSVCAVSGYAMETKCHLGQVIKYDTVSKLGWTLDLRTHGIKVVIDRILEQELEWDDDEGETKLENGEGKVKREVPKLMSDEDCVDCFEWEFGDYTV